MCFPQSDSTGTDAIATLRGVGRVYVCEFIITRQHFRRRADRSPGRNRGGRTWGAEHGESQARRIVEFEVESLGWPFAECGQNRSGRHCPGGIVHFAGRALILVIEVKSADEDDLAAREPKCRVASTPGNQRQRWRPFPGGRVIQLYIGG